MMQEVEQLSALGDEWETGSMCVKIAELFDVKPTEVALLEVRGHLLHFLYPEELRTAGAIPVSSSAVAARTIQTGRAEIFNGFARVNHFSVFELIKLGKDGLDSQVIQKLMSAPVTDHRAGAVGVIQISRKGARPNIAGPDFTAADLEKLEAIAKFLAKRMAKGKAVAKAAVQV